MKNSNIIGKRIEVGKERATVLWEGEVGVMLSADWSNIEVIHP